LSATALIGADGIHSNVRNIIMRERKRPEVKAAHCGYAYFRAVIDLSKEKDYKP
jgi:2-polyprenyl-6-methoxyphenol hydroxylase-like FAD-dependent oxidoreductase